MPKLKRNARVEYVSAITPRLAGKLGTFKRYDRNGWALVEFDEHKGEGLLKCSEISLSPISQKLEA